MSYTIYPDVLFVTNLVMDYFLLRLVKKLCRGRAGVFASLAGAALGAFGYCLLILFPVGSVGNTILAHVAINTMMVRFGCGLRIGKELFGGVAGLYIAGFLMGGMMEVVRRLTGLHRQSEVLLMGMVCYLTYAVVLPIWNGFRKKKQNRCLVRLQAGERILEADALVDTGNGLYDPVTKKPVSIIREEMLRKLLDTPTLQSIQAFQRGEADSGQQKKILQLHPHFLAFSGIGCSGGLLTAVTLDAMYLENEEVQKVIDHPVVAFSGEDSSYFGDCQMILHPNLIDS